MIPPITAQRDWSVMKLPWMRPMPWPNHTMPTKAIMTDKAIRSLFFIMILLEWRRLRTQVLKKAQKISVWVLNEKLMITQQNIVATIPLLLYLRKDRMVGGLDSIIKSINIARLDLEIDPSPEWIFQFSSHPIASDANLLDHQLRSLSFKEDKIIFRTRVENLESKHINVEMGTPIEIGTIKFGNERVGEHWER